MAPQESIPLSATVLGLIGTICWCIQLIPQIFRNHRAKNTDGAPASMFMLWAISGIPFGAYAVLQNLNIPIQVQPQAFLVLSLIAWAQCQHYNACTAWSSVRATAVCVGLCAVFGGVEAALIVGVRPVYEGGKEYPVTIIGAVAAVLLAAGLVPPCVEIWRRGGQVVGLSFVFLAVDWCGAFFSLMSLVAQNTFDVLGGVSYIGCLVLETGIFASQGIWLIRQWLGRRARVKDLESLEEKRQVGEERPTEDGNSAATSEKAAMADGL